LYNTPSEPKELDAFDQIALSLRLVTRPTSEDEYKDYNSQDSYFPRKGGALAWWLSDAQKQRWPRLTLMAINILLIPPISDKPERCFSEACRTVTWDRGQIKAETIELRELLKHWKKSGILDKFFNKSD
jgi:hypothetical protein